MTDEEPCELCDGLGLVAVEPSARQRSLAKQLRMECPDQFDIPCWMCNHHPNQSNNN